MLDLGKKFDNLTTSVRRKLLFWFRFPIPNVPWFQLHTGGGVESTVIERRQQRLSRMADFPPPVTFSVFDLKNHEVPQIKPPTMMNLVNTALPQKYGDP